MKTLATCGLVIALCGVTAVGQITMLPQTAPGSPPPATFVSPTVMDFDAGAPPAGLVGNQEPYFLAFGLCSVEIVNAPGLHTPLGDLLSSGYFGNCLASVNNQLSIVAPNGAMDNHTAGAGWRFVLAPGTFATQFGGLIVDQVNHPMAVETWFGGVLMNTFSFTMSGTGAFPNPHIYFEDLAGFDEVRFMNVGVAGGWGIDDFTLANVVGTPVPCGPTPAAPWQVNSATSSLDLDGVSGSSFAGAETTVCAGGATTLNSVSTAGTPTDIAVVFAGTGPTMALSSPNNVVNIDVFHPSMFSFNGGAPNFAGLLNLQPHPGAFSFPVPTGGPFVGSAQQLAVDPSNADGYALSQASQLTVTVGGTLTYTHADDGFVQTTLTASPVCGTSVDFYGTSYTDIFSGSNGFATFVSGSAAFVASQAEWQTLEPRIGFQTDLEPNAYGTVTLTNNGPALSGSPGSSHLTMSYANVTQWGTGGLGVTSYDIVLNGPNGHEIANFTTDGTWGITAVAGGMTLGAGGTHPPLVSFDALFGTGLQANVLGTDSVVDFNAGGMLANASGWSNIQFPLLDGSAYLVQ